MKVVRFFLFPIIVLAVLGIIVFYTQFSAPQKESVEERFVIPMDTSESTVIEDLFKKGFFKNKRAFEFAINFVCWQKKLYPGRSRTDCPEPGRRISPGAYKISKSMNAFQLAKKLLLGPYQKWVIVPSGKRKEQVALIIKKALNWPDDMTLNFIRIAQEGNIGADSYLIDTDADPNQIWQKMFGNFNEKFDGNLQKELFSKNIRTDTAIKFASIIERESGSLEDKPIIAGILWNRLDKGMRLEIDATVQYAIGTSEFAKYTADNKINYPEDFSFWAQLSGGTVRKVDSSYNTYLNEGLPPGPICSPSIESIRAVNPIETDAFYYLHSSDKQIHTAKTYKKHLKNIEEFLK